MDLLKLASVTRIFPLSFLQGLLSVEDLVDSQEDAEEAAASVVEEIVSEEMAKEAKDLSVEEAKVEARKGLLLLKEEELNQKWGHLNEVSPKYTFFNFIEC